MSWDCLAVPWRAASAEFGRVDEGLSDGLQERRFHFMQQTPSQELVLPPPYMLFPALVCCRRRAVPGLWARILANSA